MMAESCKQVIRKVLKANELQGYDICYILRNVNGELRAVAYDPNDLEKIVQISEKSDSSYAVDQVPDWDFNVDEYLLHDLENGFDVAYMDLSTHQEVWTAVDSIRGEIQYEDGLQKYLSYCQKNDITVNTISSLGENWVDISDLYNERNHSYKIIQQITIGNRSIVLGYSNINPSPYVTWETNSNRSNSYRSGHYFVNLKQAQGDFEIRAKSLFESEMERFQKPRKIKGDPEWQR